MTKYASGAVLLTVALSTPLLGSGCGGCDPEPLPVPGACDSPELKNRVDAAPFAQSAGIAGYRYTADIQADSAEVELIDDGGNAKTMRVEQVPVDDGDIRAGTMRVTLDDVTLLTRGRTEARLQHIDMTITSGGDELRIEAELKDRPCIDAEEGPHCASTVDVNAAHVLLPSCGLGYDARLRDGRAPTLVGLRYLVPMTTPPATGFRVEGGERFAVVDVFEGGSPRAANDVQADIDAVGAPLTDMLANATVRKLAAAYLDKTWRRTLELHAASCVTAGAFTFDAPTTQEAALNCGNGVSPNESSWGDDVAAVGAYVWGDPHVVTFDDVKYDFQAKGDFVTARSSPEGMAPLEVQSRFGTRSGGPAICQSVTFSLVAAVAYGGHTYQLASGIFLVDGAEADASALDARVTVSPAKFSLTTDDGTVITVSRGGYLSVRIAPSDARRGTFSGLFGNADGNPDNDFALPGENLPLERPVPFEVLYGAYRDAWRVTAETSVFHYDAGEGPDDYYDANIPASPASLDLVDDALRADAEAKCRAEGLTETDALFDCVLDVVCTGDAGLVPPPNGSGSRDGDGVVLSGALILTPAAATFDPGAPLGPGDDETCALPVRLHAAVFEEDERTLGADLALDQAGPGRVFDEGDLVPAVLPPGRVVRTYLIHLAPGKDALVTGTARFSHNIAGVVLADDGVADSAFNRNGQTVVAADARGLRLGDGSGIVIGNDLRTLEVTLRAGDDPEDVRVVVEVTP